MPLFDGTRPGPGRPKGSLSRWSRASLDAVAEVFRKLGGVDAMTEWARENPSDFYRGIYARLLPTRTEVDMQVDALRTVREMTDAELLAIIQDHADGERAALPGLEPVPAMVRFHEHD